MSGLKVNRPLRNREKVNSVFSKEFILPISNFLKDCNSQMEDDAIEERTNIGLFSILVILIITSIAFYVTFGTSFLNVLNVARDLSNLDQKVAWASVSEYFLYMVFMLLIFCYVIKKIRGDKINIEKFGIGTHKIFSIKNNNRESIEKITNILQDLKRPVINFMFFERNDQNEKEFNDVYKKFKNGDDLSVNEKFTLFNNVNLKEVETSLDEYFKIEIVSMFLSE